MARTDAVTEIYLRNRANSPLLRLPPELRRTIWRLVLGENVFRIITLGGLLRIGTVEGVDKQAFQSMSNIPDIASSAVYDFLNLRRNTRSSSDVLVDDVDTWTHSRAVLLTSRQVLLEAEDILYSASAFSFTDVGSSEIFANMLKESETCPTLSRDNLRLIREIHFEFYDGCDTKVAPEIFKTFPRLQRLWLMNGARVANFMVLRPKKDVFLNKLVLERSHDKAEDGTCKVEFWFPSRYQMPTIVRFNRFRECTSLIETWEPTLNRSNIEWASHSRT